MMEIEKLLNDLEHASTLDALDTVYIDYAEETTRRWFLATGVNESAQENVLFIGINPSSATVFGEQALGGDPTTTEICEFYAVENSEGLGVPCDYRRLAIVNLVPRVSSSPKKAYCVSVPSDSSDFAYDMEATQKLLSALIPLVDRVVLMWGDPKEPCWKEAAVENVKKAFKEAEVEQLPVVEAYLNSKKTFPCHPGWRNIRNWAGKKAVPAERFIQ